MERNYDETYLNGLIAKAKKSWEGVDVDSFMLDLRDIEKEQRVLENLKKAIKNEMGKRNEMSRTSIWRLVL